MLEAIKRAGGDPPVRKGAGYNGVYTAERGDFILKNFPDRIFKQDAPYSAPRCPPKRAAGRLLCGAFSVNALISVRNKNAAAKRNRNLRSLAPANGF